MPNQVLAFGSLLAAGILVEAAFKGDSIANVIQGKATAHPLSATAGTGSSSQGGSSGAAPAVGAGGYVNPVPGASPSRIDMGGDYTLSPSGFRAPGRSKILVADSSNSGWRGGGYIAGQLLDGPLAGSVWYVAEGVAPVVRVGQEIAAGAPVVTRTPNPYNGMLGNIEAGWADPSQPLSPLAKSTGGYIEGQVTAAGVAWDHFVKALGGVADRASSAMVGHVSGPLGAL